MRWLTLTTIVLSLNIDPSWGQESNMRIINQTNNGLAYPSSSYIGPGTLSKTAQQGAGYTPTNNPNLPKVNHGAYLGTPGDNLYSGNPDLAKHLHLVRVQSPIKSVQKQTPKSEPKPYVPNSNIPMNYSDYKPLEQDANNSVNSDNKNTLPTQN